VGFRVQPDPSNAVGYAIRIEPQAGSAELIVQPSPREETLLARRTDLSELGTVEWNTLAIRARGSGHWVLLNDRVLFAATDSTFTSGGATIIVIRLGDLDDPSETAVLIRNMRVSELAQESVQPIEEAPPPISAR
jgi:hypothetical protein